jgi:hypothetical protein
MQSAIICLQHKKLSMEAMCCAATYLWFVKTHLLLSKCRFKGLCKTTGIRTTLLIKWEWTHRWMGRLSNTLDKVWLAMKTLAGQQPEAMVVYSRKLSCLEAYPEKKLVNIEEDWHQGILPIKIWNDFKFWHLIYFDIIKVFLVLSLILRIFIL